MKKQLLITIVAFSILLSPLCEARQSKTYGHATVTKIISVYDGDTFRADLNGYPAIIGKNMSIRIYGIDTPEMKGVSRLSYLRMVEIQASAIEARDFVREMFKGADTIELRNMRRGKYFRIVADVYVDGQNLGDLLIEKGLAKKYFGGRKVRWQ